jgi:hypothetical protein
MDVFHELESLRAALEITAAPPSPTPRALAGSLFRSLRAALLCPTNSNEPLGLDSAARVRLAQNRKGIDHPWGPLSPGMAMTVEIKTGTRRLIEYFLSPVAKMKSESVRER